MECERALSLNPSLASAHAMLGLAKYLLGQGEETESHVEEALRLSPLDTFAYLWMLFAGVAAIQMEVYDKAVEWLRRSIDTNPNSPWAYFHLGAVLQLSGKATEARAETNAGLLLDPTFTTERYRSLAFSDHRRYLTIRERTIQAMQVTGVPPRIRIKGQGEIMRVCMPDHRCCSWMRGDVKWLTQPAHRRSPGPLLSSARRRCRQL